MLASMIWPVSRIACSTYMYSYIHTSVVWYTELSIPPLPVYATCQNMSLSLDRQRYSISSRSQLNEQLSRLLCYLLAHIHGGEVRAVVLRQFWALDDSQYILNFILTSTLKKTVLSSTFVYDSWTLILGSNFFPRVAMFLAKPKQPPFFSSV